MAIFKNRPWKILQRLYQWTGDAPVPDRIDLGSGAQLVHDVSRQSEVGAANEVGGRQGFVVLTKDTVHGAGATTENQHINPHGQLANNWGQVKQEIDVWLLGLGASLSASANFTAARVNLGFYTDMPYMGGAESYLGYAYFDEFVTFSDYAKTGTVDLLYESTAIPPQRQWGPIYLPQDARILMRSSATNALTISWYAYVWVGRKGSDGPPL